MKRRFLFCIVGVGAGNTTRNLAILRELEKLGPCDIRIAAQGKACEIMQKFHHTIPLRQVGYTRGGEFSAFSIIRSNLLFPLRFAQNMNHLAGIMRNFQPHLVVADSDFYCLRPARRLRIPLASINNSAVIVETIRAAGNLPANCRFSYHAIERTDYWLQRRYPDHVLCPTVRELPDLAPKFVQIPPMVRQDIEPLQKPGDEIVILTGGSGIGVSDIDLRELREEKITMLGTALDKVPVGAVHVGFTLDVMAHFRRAKVLVIQGGFSSLSEAVALRIPTVIVPIRNHAEQWSNGAVVEDLGFGLRAHSGSEAGECVKRILAEYDKYWNAAQSLCVPTDGHIVAAQKLWEWADRAPASRA